MRRRIGPIAILALACLLFALEAPARPQGPLPSLDDLKKSNVSLELSGFTFASGLQAGPDGKPNMNGVQIVPQKWVGSGFITSSDGTILTNFHVARKALAARAVFEDQSYFDVTQIKSYDPVLDIAVMKIRAQKPFSPVKLGDSDAVNVMDRVLAVGNALGRHMAVTEGMINQVSQDDNNVRFQIRHSATIAPGNSGGALYRGDEVIAINVAMVPGLSIYYSIPINLAKPLLNPSSPWVPLEQAFPTDLESILKRAKQFLSQSDRVAGATKDGGGTAGFTVNLPSLSDIVFAVSSPGRNLALAVTDAENKLIGLGDLPVADMDMLIIDNEYASQVNIWVVNKDKQPANFALSGYLIQW